MGEADVERALFRWFERFQRRRGGEMCVTALVGVAELRRKALALARRLGAPATLTASITRAWVRRWQARYGVPSAAGRAPEPPPPPPQPPPQDEVTITAVPPAESQRPLADYSDEQVYVAVALELCVSSLPDRALWGGGDRVWILGAADREGRHRTRLLVAGQHWRPACLAHVNMLSQPVVYAGGGTGALTPDLFSWWFGREFCPAASAVHGSRGAVLVVEPSAPFLPSEECVSEDGTIRLVTSAAPDTSVVAAELRARYGQLLLQAMSVAPDTETPERFLDRWTLRDAFPQLHRAWLAARPDAFVRCWSRGDADRLLLLELQWAAHDRGLEVADADLSVWTRGEDLQRVEVKKEPEDPEQSSAAATSAPSAAEAAEHLRQALRWMESQPLEPSLLLLVGDLVHVANQARAHAPTSSHHTLTFPHTNCEYCNTFSVITVPICF